MRRLIAILLVASAASAFAAGPTTKPAAAKPKAPEPAAENLKVTVVSVAGPAQKLLAGKGQTKWQPLKAGEELGELTVIRTGLGAKVVLKFEDRGEVIVNNATKIGLGELRKKGNEATARLGLKYGTIRASVEAEKGKNDFRIATPVATLSVRGSSADAGFMVDSTRMLQAYAGRWWVQKVLGTGTQEETFAVIQRMVEGGETMNSQLEAPIRIIMATRFAGVSDAFGITPSEQESLIQNPTGKRVSNTPSGGSDDPTGQGDGPQPTPPPDDEPGYP